MLHRNPFCAGEDSETVPLLLACSVFAAFPKQAWKVKIFAWDHFSLGTVSEGHSWLNRWWLREWFSCSLPALSPCSSEILKYSWLIVIFFLFLLFLSSPEAPGLGSSCVTLIHLALSGSLSQDPKRSLIKLCFILQKWNFQMIFLPQFIFLTQCQLHQADGRPGQEATTP